MMHSFDCSASVTAQPLHCHDELELIAVYRGRGRLLKGRVRQETSPELLAIVCPQEVHAGEPASKDFAVRGLEVPAASILQLNIDWTSLLWKGPVIRSPKIANAFMSTFQAVTQRASKLEIETALLVLLHAIRPVFKGSPAREKSKVDLAVEVLRSNLASDISLSELAAYVDLTPEYLCRAFRKETGLPPHAYRCRLRAARAVTLLRRGVAASEAAIAVGFYDQSHLARHLKAHFGRTTTEILSEVNPVLLESDIACYAPVQLLGERNGAWKRRT